MVPYLRGNDADTIGGSSSSSNMSVIVSDTIAGLMDFSLFTLENTIKL